MWRHPKYYKELRKRNKLDQAISLRESETSAGERAPGPGQSLTRDSNADGGEGSSAKHQASSVKSQAPEETSDKRQAPSNKPQA